MSFVSPFARQGNWTVFDNALVDTLMPHLPPGAWKVLTAILRQTSGWQREAVGASQQDLAETTGMRPSTVAAALAVLLDDETLPPEVHDRPSGPLLVSDGATRSRRAPTTYSLNPGFRLRTSVVRRLRSAEPGAASEVTVRTARVTPAQSPSTAIFEVLSTAIFEALYIETKKEAKGGAAPQPPSRLSDVADHLAALAEAAPVGQHARILVRAARALYGPVGIPEGREALVEAGALRKAAGGTGAAMRLLLRHALEGSAAGSPFRYAMAADAGRRRDVGRARAEGAPERLAAAGPAHGATYDVATTRALVAAGAPREAFEGAGTTPSGEKLFRFIDPARSAPTRRRAAKTP